MRGKKEKNNVNERMFFFDDKQDGMDDEKDSFIMLAIVDTVNTGKCIKKEMEKHGMSRKTLSAKAGVSQQAVSKWINGSLPSIDNLFTLQYIFGLESLNDLVVVRYNKSFIMDYQF